MRHTTTVLIALAVSLSACSGTGDKAPPPSASPSPAPITTASAPTPPAMPPAARAHTRAGAKAFVEYFWKVVDDAARTLDSRRLSELSDVGCLGCRGAIDFVDDMRSGRATFSGATTQISRVRVGSVSLGGRSRTEVVFDVTTPNQIVDYPGTGKDERYRPATSHTHFYLGTALDGWRVVLWEKA